MRILIFLGAVVGAMVFMSLGFLLGRSEEPDLSVGLKLDDCVHKMAEEKGITTRQVVENYLQYRLRQPIKGLFKQAPGDVGRMLQVDLKAERNTILHDQEQIVGSKKSQPEIFVLSRSSTIARVQVSIKHAAELQFLVFLPDRVEHLNWSNLKGDVMMR